MTRHILLTGVPSLLASQGLGHQPPVVVVCPECGGYFAAHSPKCPNPGQRSDWALPLFWNDAPCRPAIHALVDAAEAAEASLNPLELYELLADRFHRKTGMMAPGKDMPSAMMGGGTREERRSAWTEWNTENHQQFWDRLRRAACLSYEKCLEMTNEAAPLLGGRVGTR